jgi:hypothetical protein
MTGHMSRNNFRADPAKVSLEPLYPIDERNLWTSMQSYRATWGERNTNASSAFGARLLNFTADVGTAPSMTGGTTRQTPPDALLTDLRTIQNAGEIPSPYWIQ